MKCKKARPDIQNVWIHTKLKRTYVGIGYVST